MFCSNQVFTVCGDKNNIKALESSIRTIINGFEFRPRFYKIEESGLSFYQYNPDKEGIIEISKEDLIPEYYLSIIQLYFNSHNYRECLRNTFNEFANADGSSHEGWKISIDNRGFGHNIVVKPFWCFYHK